ncbi:hypothetical protein [Serratia nevei]|uniref:hypothetical protein n=1 Tax=Serratia nevei TaxID=2703794 RepID=UPI002549E950|nr:hypothetical protein [Serratia nevei]MDK5165550.1 hypothetical protein [Serratia nevei]
MSEEPKIEALHELQGHTVHFDCDELLSLQKAVQRIVDSLPPTEYILVKKGNFDVAEMKI